MDLFIEKESHWHDQQSGKFAKKKLSSYEAFYQLKKKKGNEKKNELTNEKCQIFLMSCVN